MNSSAWPLRKSHMAPGKFFIVVKVFVTKGTWEWDEEVRSAGIGGPVE